MSLAVCLTAAACQSLPPTDRGVLAERLDESIQVLASPDSGPRQRSQAAGAYRQILAATLGDRLQEAAQPRLSLKGGRSGQIRSPSEFTGITPVQSPRDTRPGLHRAGLGLPAVGHMAAGADPNAPPAGYQIPLTLISLPEPPPATCCESALVDPDQVRAVRTAHGDAPLAMDLEAPIRAVSVTGPRLGAGLMNLVRPGAFSGQPRIVFMEPFDPDKRPLVLVHGLLSTPRMWAPLVLDLLADSQVRANYQIWFFYYPTGQPVPLSALQLREALDDAAARYRPRYPMVLVGHSMGGILSRAQVSEITERQAETMVPGVAGLPDYSRVRRALIFEPRADVGRVVFMFTPHRGSRLATSGLGSWGIRLIRLPDILLSEIAIAADHLAGTHDLRLPTSIHGLSPDSQFLSVLDTTKPVVPTHSVIGDRGRGTGWASSDGVVPYTSSHLASAESEVAVPTGHGGFTHPEAVKELKRILYREAKNVVASSARDSAPKTH